MTIREWIRDREISGFPTFSVEEIRLALPHYSEQVIKNDLFRISSQGIIYPVYKGFYVIIPPHYAAKRMVPPIYYIDQLMSYLNKPYYISLLNAAEIHGAAHQRPQKFSVMSVFPKSSVSQSKNNTLVWVYRKEIPTDFLLSKNSETGVIYYSNAELTALDIVQYAHWSLNGRNLSSTKTLFPTFLAPPCNGSAIRFPNPPSGILSWFGKKRSYESKEILPFRFIASVRMILPNRLTLIAGIASVKKTHTCAPFPDLERSMLHGTFQSRQTETNANTSSLYP